MRNRLKTANSKHFSEDYYMVKDHLGNICAVVNANTDTVVQRTMYYASGVPMAQSWGRDTQPDTGLTEYYFDIIALPLHRVQGVLDLF